jgi:hypothetical protein
MTSPFLTRAGIAAAPAIAWLAGATPTGSDRDPARRVHTNQHGAEVAQELNYTSHKPSIQRPVMTSARSTPTTPARPTRTGTVRAIDEPPSGNGFDRGEATIGAGGVLAFACGAAAITRRHRRAEGLEMS